MGAIAVLLAKLLDPIGFVIALVVVLLSRQKWIILVAAAVAAIAVETLLSSTQYTRTWGQGLPIGFVAGLIHGGLVFSIRARFTRRREQATPTDPTTATTPTPNTDDAVADDDNPVSRVEEHLRIMGYDLTPYGAGVALLELESGYNEVETASHIAHTTLALDVKEAGTDIEKLLGFVPHGTALLELLKDYKDRGMMRESQWRNDSTAVFRVINVDQHHEEWIAKILSDPIAGKQRLARSRVARSR